MTQVEEIRKQRAQCKAGRLMEIAGWKKTEVRRVSEQGLTQEDIQLT
jgi:hypothetical protein